VTFEHGHEALALTGAGLHQAVQGLGGQGQHLGGIDRAAAGLTTYQKAHHFRQPARLDVLQRGILKLTADFNWHLEAWAVFSNHYHLIARPESQADASTLKPLLSKLHEKTAKWINKLDGVPGRKVWHNYRDTILSFEKSYFARLNYVHQNPVRHGLVAVANQYPWGSAGWFERTTSASMVKTIYRFKTDRLQVLDEYDPSSEW
jgi:putative transposase